MQQRSRHSATGKVFEYATLAAIIIPLALLGLLFVDVLTDGLARLDWDFITGFPSRHPEDAGILPGLIGSILLVVTTALLAIPIGVGAAIYLEEYAGKELGSASGEGFAGKMSILWDKYIATIIEVNVANLAGVPSVIYGLLGLELFVRLSGFGHTIIAGAMTLALLILPIVIIASREAIRSVPQHLREAAFGLGATRWQVIRHTVLPAAIPGILTGAILSISRAIGETAPIIVVGALTYITFVPNSLQSQFTALPIQIFNWVSRPQQEFAVNAAAGIIVLLGTVILLNALAIIVRNRTQRKQ
jgi:phosphate transport system permease protein